ncbi:N-acetylmannosamine kinase [Clostridia bacterium]|nr:N-acetylmannosamine kinase [Clostridia bacterium]
MNKDILSALSAGMSAFSKGQRAIANFILARYDEAAFMTAGRVAAAAGVSESTVVRFAVELGFDGYQQMQRGLQEVIRNRLTTAQRVGVTQSRLEGQDLLRTVMLADTEKIRATLENLDRAAFDSVVDAIVSARNVYVVGIRSASALSGFLAFYLNMIRENVRLVSASAMSETIEQVMRISCDDAVIGISFPRYSRRTVRAMKYARERGATVIALSDSPDSPLCQTASHSLLAKCDTSLFLDSLVAPLSLINALIAAVGLRNSGELSETMRRLEDLWGYYEVYQHD